MIQVGDDDIGALAKLELRHTTEDELLEAELLRFGQGRRSDSRGRGQEVAAGDTRMHMPCSRFTPAVSCAIS